MGWFSKDEEVPQIIPAPALPELPKKEDSKKRDLPELPTFPNNSKNETFNQEMVKSAIGDIPSSRENEINVDIPEDFHITEKPREKSLIPPRPPKTIPELPKHIITSNKIGMYKTVHDPSWYSEQHGSIQEIPKKETPKLNAIPENKPILNRTEPIFVRIDKFQSAQKNFEQVKEKVKEIESILEKIKDIKLKEEAELKGWTEDVEKVKLQLSEIDSGIFNQI